MKPTRGVEPRQGQRQDDFEEDMPFMGGKGLGGRKVSEKKAETMPKGQVRSHGLTLRSRHQSPEFLTPHPAMTSDLVPVRPSCRL